MPALEESDADGRCAKRDGADGDAVEGLRFCVSGRRYRPTRIADMFRAAGRLHQLGDVFGFLWDSPLNGGRNRSGSLSFALDEIAALNDRGVGYSFTLTNLAAAEHHLADAHTNAVLKRFENPLNSITVATPLVEEYIRSRYPGYRLRTSCIYNLKTADAINAACERFDMVTPWPDVNDDEALLARLEQKDKIMLFGMQLCLKTCGDFRMRHYYFWSLDHIAYHHHQQFGTPYRAADFAWPYPPPCRGRVSPVEFEDLARLRRLGFRHIKITQPRLFAERYLGARSGAGERLREKLRVWRERLSIIDPGRR